MLPYAAALALATLAGCGGPSVTDPATRVRVVGLSARFGPRYCVGPVTCPTQVLFGVVDPDGRPAYSVPVTVTVSAGEAPSALVTPARDTTGGAGPRVLEFTWYLPQSGGPYEVTVCPDRNPDGCARAAPAN